MQLHSERPAPEHPLEPRETMQLHSRRPSPHPPGNYATA